MFMCWNFNKNTALFINNVTGLSFSIRLPFSIAPWWSVGILICAADIFFGVPELREFINWGKKLDNLGYILALQLKLWAFRNFQISYYVLRQFWATLKAFQRVFESQCETRASKTFKLSKGSSSPTGVYAFINFELKEIDGVSVSHSDSKTLWKAFKVARNCQR